MIMTELISTAVVLLLLTAGALPTTAGERDDPIVPPRFTRSAAVPGFSYKGVARTYHVKLPLNYTNKLPTQAKGFPVLFALHGNGADGTAFALQTPVLFEQAPARGYILVYPDGVQTPGSTLRCRERSWNSGSCCDEAYLANVDDVSFIDAVLDDIIRHYPTADTNRVFATGSSNGGSMVVRLACELPFRFAAVAPEIGSYEGRDGSSCAGECDAPSDDYEQCSWDRHRHGCRHGQWARDTPEIFSCAAIRESSVSMLFFNGNLDSFSNISGLIERPTRPFNGSYTSSFPPMDFALDYLREESGCRLLPLKISFSNGTAGNSTVCHTYQGDGTVGCTSNLTYCVSDAGHRWYGSTYDVPKLCEWMGYAPEDCTWKGDMELYGPNTFSIRVAEQLLDFFAVQGW